MAIKLGGGGGSASQINEVVLLNNTADLVTLSDGRKYLKGGTYETNLATYPDASTSLGYLGTSFYVGSQDTAPQGITWDGTHFWVIGYGTDAVYKYTSAGVYTGTSFSVASQETTPTGITWDGTHFWVVGVTTAVVYKYTSAGVYTGTSFSVLSQNANPYDITWDGTHFWVIGLTGDIVYK
jgi:hypothetical protein